MSILSVVPVAKPGLQDSLLTCCSPVLFFVSYPLAHSPACCESWTVPNKLSTCKQPGMKLQLLIELGQWWISEPRRQYSSTKPHICYLYLKQGVIKLNKQIFPWHRTKLLLEELMNHHKFNHKTSWKYIPFLTKLLWKLKHHPNITKLRTRVTYSIIILNLKGDRKSVSEFITIFLLSSVWLLSVILHVDR